MIHRIQAFYNISEFYRRLARIIGTMLGVGTLLLTITQRDINLTWSFGGYAVALLCLGIFGSERLNRWVLIPGAIMGPICIDLIFGSVDMRTYTIPLILTGLLATVMLSTLAHGAATERRWAASVVEAGALLVTGLCIVTAVFLILTADDRNSVVIGVAVNLFWAVVFFLAARSLRRKRLQTSESTETDKSQYAPGSR